MPFLRPFLTKTTGRRGNRSASACRFAHFSDNGSCKELIVRNGAFPGGEEPSGAAALLQQARRQHGAVQFSQQPLPRFLCL